MDDSSDILGGQLNVARVDTLSVTPGPSLLSLFLYAIVAIASVYGLQLVYPLRLWLMFIAVASQSKTRSRASFDARIK